MSIDLMLYILKPIDIYVHTTFLKLEITISHVENVAIKIFAPILKNISGSKQLHGL